MGEEVQPKRSCPNGNLLKEKGLGNYDDLTAHSENLSARFDALSDSIKVAEKRMVEVQALQQHIKNYRNTRQIYIEYRKSWI